MQLAILTAVLAAIAAAEGGGGPVAGIAWRLVVIVSAALVAPLAALVGTQRLAGTISWDERSDEAISRLQSVITCFWLGAVGIILLVGQWPRIVRSNWGLAAWPLLDELAILLPVLLPLALIWAVLYRLERSVQLAACRARSLEPPPARLGAHLIMQARHHLGLVLIPPLAIVGFLEGLGYFGTSALQLDAAWWLAIPLVGTVLVAMPLVVRSVWRTTPLPVGPLRAILDDVCRGRRCTVRDILFWDTDHTMANAAVVGISRFLRYVLLSDVLVVRLTDLQIAAVVRHELAHLRRWHLPLRLALLLLPVAWWLAIEHVWPEALLLPAQTLLALGIQPQLATAMILPIGMLVYAFIVVGSYSRLLEHDADLDACRDNDGTFNPQLADDFSSALVTLCGGLRENRVSQWLHPAASKRVELIRRAAKNPAVLSGFLTRLRWLTAGIALLYLAAGAMAFLG